MSEEYASKNLDHYGIVSVMCDQIGVVEMIDEMIKPDKRAEITVGEMVKLMIINGLGFTSRPLYLEAQFFSNKPIERFLGREIGVDQITDDRLGKCLDFCYEYGCDEIFGEISTRAALAFNIDKRFRHLDSTSMSVSGEYNEEDIGLIKFGYSKDGKSDLKQFMVYLMSSKDGGVPLLAQTVSGNTSDKKQFKEILNALKSQIDPNEPAYYVADSALYTKETIREISKEMMWISRVPEAIKEAKEVIAQTKKENMEDIGNGYRIRESKSTYGDVDQRWLVVFSEQAYAKESTNLQKQIAKELDDKKRELRNLNSVRYGCAKDAQAALASFEKILKYHICTNITIEEIRSKKGRGRPKKEVDIEIAYMINASLEEDPIKINTILEKKGKFIIATNELDHSKLSNINLLPSYKEQQCVERGFRFLKDPLFMTSSVFLKNQKRIVALSMIMCLCLLVYSLAQRLLRKRISQLQTKVSNQNGKPTTKPTLRWIFQVFEGVHILIHKTKDNLSQIVLNLTHQRLLILEILGPHYQIMYQNFI